jgi:2-oxoglutarate ferredoxin oxidoreductase subunit gamma
MWVSKMKNEKVMIAGFGGQGVMMIGQMLAYAANEENLATLWFPSYGPETRGGTANCTVIISDQNINSPFFSKADTLIVLNKPSLDRFITKTKAGGILIYNSSLISEKVSPEGVKVYGVPMNDIALRLGNPKVANMVIMGAYMELTGLFQTGAIEKVLKKILGHNKEHLVGINLEAIEAGHKFIQELRK